MAHKLQNHFQQSHPAVKTTFFLTAVVWSFVSVHPVFVLLNLASAIGYAACYGKIKTLLYCLPMVALIGIINPLFNHQGRTVLFQLFGSPITGEAFCYGLFSGLAVAAVVLWFSNLQATVSNRQLTRSISRWLPSIGLMITMIFRFIPTLSWELRQIANVQQTLGVQTKNGSIWQRIRSGCKLLMVLLNMSLENTLITAQSMQARGYGLGRKTNANRRSVRWQEIVFLGTAVCCLVLSLALGGSLFFEANYFPSLNFGQPSLQTAMGALCLAVGLNLPMVYNGWEEAAWHYYRSKI